MDHLLTCHEIVKTDMVRGHDCYLYDAHGRRYVDFEAGVWCAALGHNHARINRVIRSQTGQLMHVGYRYTNILAEEAAVAVLDTIDLVDGKCTFLNSGSEAVEFGVQVARRLTGQPLLLTFAGSYLAALGSAGRKSPAEWHSFDWGDCAACPHPEGCNPACDRLQEIPFERIGGLVFEPGNTFGLVKFPPRPLVQTLVERIKAQQGLVVVDEVTTGLGRTGAWYGYQHYGLEPDIVALGKGLGNGYPISAVALTGEIAERLESSVFRYAQSHQNDPLGCAVAREVITVMRAEGLVERSWRVGTRFLQQLAEFEARHKIIKEARGRGLMIALEFEGIDENFSITPIYRQLLTNGFLVGYNPVANVIRFYPPLTIAETDITRLLACLDQIIETLA